MADSDGGDSMWSWLATAGLGGLANLLGGMGGATDDPQVRTQGYAGWPDPMSPPSRGQLVGTAIGDAASAQENWLASLMGQAMAPVSLPGAVVQPLQGFGNPEGGGFTGTGGVLPFRIGADAVDPAWSYPQLMVQPGINTGGVQEWGRNRVDAQGAPVDQLSGYLPGGFVDGRVTEGTPGSQFGFIRHDSPYLLPDQEMGQFWSALDVLFGDDAYTPWEPEDYVTGGVGFPAKHPSY